MRNTMIGLTICALAVGCSGEAPTSAYDLRPGDALLARQAAVKNYHATLSGAAEVPAVETLARGSAQFTVTDDRESISYRVNVANIQDVTMSHIHLGPPDDTGGVVVWLYPGGPPPEAIPGRSSGILAEGTITADDLVGALAGMTIEDLIDEFDAGNAYVNVHTVVFGGGEVRGQIR